MKKAGKFEVLLMLFILAVVGCVTIPDAISEMNRKEVVAVDSLLVFTTDGVVRGIIVGGQMPTHIYCIPTNSFMEFRNEDK